MPKTTAQDVILEILRSADGEWTGKTKLFKAFYFAHLFYANENPGLLTHWSIARMPEGPGIHNSDELFQGLLQEGSMTMERVREGPYPEFRYRLTDSGKAKPSPPEKAQWAIKEAALFCKDKTASELSQLTHERSRSWQEGENGDLLDIYIDTIPADEFEKRNAEIKRLEQVMAEALKD